MSDRFYTIMIVPDKSKNVRKIVLPARYFQLLVLIALFTGFLGVFVLVHYIDVLGQVAENKRLRVENRSLAIDIKRSSNKLESLDQNVGRLRDFANKLRVLGNLGEPDAMKTLEAPDPKAGQGLPLDETRGDISDPKKKDSGSIAEQKYEHIASTTPSLPASTEDDENRIPSILGNELTLSRDAENLLVQVSQVGRLSEKLNDFSKNFEEDLASLYEYLQDRADQLMHTPSILPTKGYMSSRFGHRYNPFSGTKTFHAGLDVANHHGTPIFAPAAGVVKFAGQFGGFGLVLIIDHGYNIITKYGHNSKLLVNKGERIKRGQKVAQMGSSGRSTGPHLHYQVEVNGRPVNPINFILDF